MENDFTTRDKNDALVAVGTRVRVLAIAPSILERLTEDENRNVTSMLGETFEVYEVDQWGGAWVAQWWHHSDSKAMSHSIGLKPEEMEVVGEVTSNDRLLPNPCRIPDDHKDAS